MCLLWMEVKDVDLLLIVIAVLEMTAINLYVSYIFSNKKYSYMTTWITLFVFTSLLLIFIFSILKDKPSFGNGNGLFMLLGFIYLIPFNLLYKQSIKYTFTIMCSTWIYTMATFSLSVRLAYLINERWFAVIVISFQTAFYLLTLPKFLSFVKNRFVGIVDNVDDKILTVLMQFGFFWFITAVLINYSFVIAASNLLKLLITILIMISGFVSFKLFYLLVVVSERVNVLNEKTRKDPLTDLNNRVGLMVDARALIATNSAFSIVFIDFDDFKKINDQYGHNVGDNYLITFAKITQTLFADEGSLYRISGDEFVFLYRGDHLYDFCENISDKIYQHWQYDIKFLGFSLGCSSFPEDGKELTTLMSLADFDMYQQKKIKHKLVYD